MLAANVISVAGNSLTQLAVPWYVLQSTGSSARAGIVAFCSLFPGAVSASVCGPLIDRVGRRRMSVISDLACGASIAAVPLLQLGGGLRFWMLCALMACAGACSVPGTTARGVLVPALAQRAGARLVRVASLYDGAARCAAMIGAALGGVLAGALLYGAVGHRWRRWPVFTAAFLIVGMPRFAVAACTGTVAPLAVMMAIEGLACGALNPIRTTVVYEIVPDHLRSPVVSAMTAAGMAAAPFGGLITGIFVATAGLFTTTLVIGCVYLAVTLRPLLSATWREIG